MPVCSRLVPLVLAVLAVMLVPADARGSCVSGPTICRAYKRVSAIFSGEVQHITLSEEGKYVVRVRVERVWKGALQVESRVELRQGGGPRVFASSDFPFQAGGRYLIWASPVPGKPDLLQTDVCLPTKHLASADRDIEYLKSLSGPPTGGQVFGRVWLTAPDSKGGKGLTVVLEGAGVRRETQAEADGTYHFKGLAAGKYDVRLVLPPHVAFVDVLPWDLLKQPPLLEPPAPAATVVIEDSRDCAEVEFLARRRPLPPHPDPLPRCRGRGDQR